MSLPYHSVFSPVSNGATMFNARATQLRDLPPQFLAAFGANVRTPYRVYNPQGEVITDREGKYRGGIFTPLDVIDPEIKRATTKAVTLRAPDPALVKLLEEQKIEAAAKKLVNMRTKDLQKELTDLKQLLTFDEENLYEEMEKLLEVKGSKVKDAKAKEDVIEKLSEEGEIGEEGVGSKVPIIKTTDLSIEQLNKGFKKLPIITGYKGSRIIVKQRIAERFEKATGIPFNQLLQSKIDTPRAAEIWVEGFNKEMSEVLPKERSIITAGMLDELKK